MAKGRSGIPLRMDAGEAAFAERLGNRLRAEVTGTPENSVICPCCRRSQTLRKEALAAKLPVLKAFWEASGHRVGHPVAVRTAQKWLLDHGGGFDPAYSNLKHWGLLEPVDDSGRPRKLGPGPGNIGGYWAVTGKARRFLLGQISLPPCALVYDDTCYGFAEGLPRWWDPKRKRGAAR